MNGTGVRCEAAGEVGGGRVRVAAGEGEGDWGAGLAFAGLAGCDGECGVEDLEGGGRSLD